MAHRERRTAQNPDVEASKTELAAIDASKSTSQNEVLAIAANKKQLEADFEVAKKKLANELTAKRSEVAAEIKKLDESLLVKKSEVDATVKMAAQAVEETKQLIATCDAIQKEVTEANEKRSAANTEVTRLMTLQHNLNESIADARTDYKDAEVKLETKKKELAALDIQIKEKADGHDRIVYQIPVITKEHDDMQAAVNELGTQAKTLNKELIEKTEKKTALDAELLETQKKVAEHKQSMAALESEISTKAGNAARLEQHVDAKLTHLKALEAQFTTEHLARFGYKKTE